MSVKDTERRAVLAAVMVWAGWQLWWSGMTGAVFRYRMEVSTWIERSPALAQLSRSFGDEPRSETAGSNITFGSR